MRFPLHCVSHLQETASSDRGRDPSSAVNEHELSLFNLAEYKEFQKDPEVRLASVDFAFALEMAELTCACCPTAADQVGRMRRCERACKTPAERDPSLVVRNERPSKRRWPASQPANLGALSRSVGRQSGSRSLLLRGFPLAAKVLAGRQRAPELPAAAGPGRIRCDLL